MEMNDKPLVSVLIPLYNQERHFGACMRSVRKQTYTNLEVIVVNDGSTDRSPQMAHKWASQDNRVRVIDKQNEGVIQARKDAIGAATGEYVCFLDSDDKLTSRSIESMVKSIQETGVDVVIGMFDHCIGRFITHRKADSYCTFPCGQVIKQPDLFDKYYINFFASGCAFPVIMCAKLYRKSLIDKVRSETELFSPTVNLMGEDLYFNMKLFPYVRSMYRIDESVYVYRHGGGTLGYNKNFQQLFVLSDERLKALDQCNYAQGYEPLFSEYVAFLLHHASQLLHFKKAEKEDIINFFKQETQSRELVSRMVDYYAEKECDRKGVQLLMNHDYESMYENAVDLSKRVFGSKYKVVKSMIKILDFFS